jgi:hypothetical protein
MGRVVAHGGLLFVVLSFAGCDTSRRAESEAERSSWTILAESEAEALRKPCSRPFPAGLQGEWLPNSEEVQQAESRIGAALDAAFHRLETNDPAIRLQDYRRQYFGFWRKGEQVLYVNAVASDPSEEGNEDWRTRAFSMCDGGTRSFGAVFDLSGQTFDSFYFDGSYAGPLPGGGGR